MKIEFNKEGLVPVIIQNSKTLNVLMLGYMNQEAFDLTVQTNLVTFYSRKKNRLWTKGEESGNTLSVVSILNDCDNDSLLITVVPAGPTCHKGTLTCWGDPAWSEYHQLDNLESIIANRIQYPVEGSYISSLLKKGINKVAQKVGEEAVEVVIEAKDSDNDLFLNESADLLFHYLILLQAKGFKLVDVLSVLKDRES